MSSTILPVPRIPPVLPRVILGSAWPQALCVLAFLPVPPILPVLPRVVLGLAWPQALSPVSDL